MSDHQPILAGVEGTSGSSAAARFAVREARRPSAPLRHSCCPVSIVPPADETGSSIALALERDGAPQK